MTKLHKRYLLISISLVLIVVGLKFASTGVGVGNMIQDDGYNVTGGLLTLIGGFILGAIYGDKK